MSEVGELSGAASRSLAGPVPEPAGRPSPAEGIPALRPGELIQAQLVEAQGAGEGVVDIAGRLFHALYPDGLTEGERLTLRVASLGPPVVLKPPDPIQEALGRLLRPPATGFSASVQALLTYDQEGLGPVERELLAGIQRLLALVPSSTMLAENLSRFLNQSGLFHEALLAHGRLPEDLKALVLRLLPRIEKGPLAAALEGLLGHVEAHQARSLLEGMPVIPFALVWGEETVHGEWVVEERSAPGSDGTAASGCIRIRLQMPNLGHADVTVRWGPVGTSARLRMQPTAVEAASVRMAELREALARVVNPRLVGIRLEAFSDEPTPRGPARLEVLA